MKQLLIDNPPPGFLRVRDIVHRLPVPITLKRAQALSYRGRFPKLWRPMTSAAEPLVSIQALLEYVREEFGTLLPTATERFEAQIASLVGEEK